MSEPLVIIGAGGHARELAQMHLIGRSDSAFIGFLDDTLAGVTPEGWPILGPTSSWTSHAKAHFAVAVNDPRTRRSAVARVRQSGEPRWVTLSHPEVKLGPHVRCGVGCQFMGGCQVTTSVRLGDFCIVNRGSQVGHDCIVGDYASLNPQSCISGCCMVGHGCELGAGCLLRQGVRMQEGAMAGMGAVVIEDVPANAVVVGNPARFLKSLPAW